jgi:hypothetical protein
MVATLALVAMGGACTSSGGGALTLEEYFRELDLLDEAFSQASDEVDGKIQETQDVGEAHGYMEEQVTAFEDFLEGLQDLDAPDEVADPHADAIAGIDLFIDELSSAVDAAASATTFDELFAPFESIDSTGIEQAIAACVELEQIAADNNIEVDLDCDDESDEPVEEPTTEEPSEEPSGALEEYFQELDTAENRYRSLADTVTEELSALDDTEVADAVALIREQVVAIDGFVRELQEIDPPAEAATAHAETIAGFQAVTALLNSSLPELEGVATLSEMNAFFSSEEFTSIDASLDGVCAALESIAQTNGITVDLGCE